MKKLFSIVALLMILFRWRGSDCNDLQLSFLKINMILEFLKKKQDQTYDFILTNTGNLPLVIQNIVASCGCTTPEWTRHQFLQEEKGKLTAIYDPRDRPGAFNKTLSVYTNTKPEVTVLVIKGEVTPREKTIEELFTFPVGSIRFESSQLAFTNVKKN